VQTYQALTVAEIILVQGILLSVDVVGVQKLLHLLEVVEVDMESAVEIGLLVDVLELFVVAHVGVVDVGVFDEVLVDILEVHLEVVDPVDGLQVKCEVGPCLLDFHQLDVQFERLFAVELPQIVHKLTALLVLYFFAAFRYAFYGVVLVSFFGEATHSHKVVEERGYLHIYHVVGRKLALRVG